CVDRDKPLPLGRGEGRSQCRSYALNGRGRESSTPDSSTVEHAHQRCLYLGGSEVAEAHPSERWHEVVVDMLTVRPNCGRLEPASLLLRQPLVQVQLDGHLLVIGEGALGLGRDHLREG